MTARRGEESQERVVFSVQCSGQSSLHLLLDILGLKVPLDVDHSDVDHAEHKHAAPETGAAPDNGLEWSNVSVRKNEILLETHLYLGRGPEAGEDLPDLPGDVHGGEDLVVDGRVRGLTWLTGLRIAMNTDCQEDDGQHPGDGHGTPDYSLTLAPCLRMSALSSTDSSGHSGAGLI